MLLVKYPAVMGILNVTPDSFSDGGRYIERQAAVSHAASMIEQGADIIDVGGESTRPGSAPVSCDEELERVVPVIEAIRRISDIPISVDTSTPEVMRGAALAGATMINDVRALRMPGALDAAAETGLPVCLMHMQGEPKTMQDNPSYRDLIGEITDFFIERIAQCKQAGIAEEKLIVDPGFGFGKTLAHNLTLINRLHDFCSLGRPVLVGLSRKSTIGHVIGESHDRLMGSVAGAVMAIARGASIVRVHDVGPTVEALEFASAIIGETTTARQQKIIVK